MMWFRLCKWHLSQGTERANSCTATYQAPVERNYRSDISPFVMKLSSSVMICHHLLERAHCQSALVAVRLANAKTCNKLPFKIDTVLVFYNSPVTVVSFWSIYFQHLPTGTWGLLPMSLAAGWSSGSLRRSLRHVQPHGSSKSCAVGVATVSLTSNPCASFWSHGSASAFHRKSQESLPKRRKTVDSL